MDSDSEDLRSLLLMQRQMAPETATKAALIHGLKSVDVMVKGPGSGREALSEHFQQLVLKLQVSRMLLQFHIMDAVHQSVEEFNLGR